MDDSITLDKETILRLLREHKTSITVNEGGIANMEGSNPVFHINFVQRTKEISPTQGQIVNALKKLSANERGRMNDVCWWGAWRFLTDYGFVAMNKSQFSIYLVDNKIVEKNPYENFRNPGGNVDNVLRMNVGQWSNLSGSVSPSIQNQIEVAKFLSDELFNNGKWA